ncbi:WXG100 family type VII secretion target [Nocardia sp. NPDC058480]|uniref:WXG100 family type VII secretion target n=1 Tax=Nocardia sp. NPDC058480 TaxID=3346522 RepID=UPI003669AC81
MTGTEGKQIPPTTEYPPNWKHQDILSAFERIATEPANGAAAKYRESGTQWTQALEQFRQRMEVSIASAWEGSSADASINAIRQYTTDADKLTPAFTSMSEQVAAAATSAVNTKSALPGEVDPGFLDSMPWNKAVVRGQREEAENQAREVMDNKYVMPFAGTDGAIPILPRPTNPTQQQNDPGDKPVGITTDNGGGKPNTDSTGTQPSTDAPDDPAATPETPAEDSAAEDPSTSDPGVH